ncbi:uncharacterized protein K02A2.6-like [Ixodes scapularis]|uniref:uncharacterized protein K02A2.6-like n=1 Tax=Ixodes scapularis TaxID=6945 RepID=UPI001C3873FE|nr:uncharacterized protein K02A2.6-like [Ixodes scapularis]
MALQRYSLEVKFIPGKDLQLADALSRFPTKETMQEEEEKFQVNSLDHISVTQDRLNEIRDATAADVQMRLLREYAQTSWPEQKEQVPQLGRPFWSYREEIHEEDGLVLPSNKIIIPTAIRSKILNLLHTAHAGKDKMKRRAREILFWPGINADIDREHDECSKCEKYKSRNAKMPLLSHALPTLPWQLVGTDFFTHEGKDYIILVDFYSFYFEVEEMKSTTASKVKEFCLKVFATHGLPLKLISDNGPPFGSQEFKQFLENLKIKQVTSSPYHARSNGMAERAVRQAKQLLRKSANTEEFYRSLLEWRNTPRDDVLQSPVQRLMSRHTRTLLPARSEHYLPAVVPPKAVTRRLTEIRRQQKANYDKSSRTLPDIDTGSTVTVYNTLRRTWSPAIVVGHPVPRSYDILTPGGRVHRRTREHLRTATDSRRELTSTGKDTACTEQSPSDFSQGQPHPEARPRRGTRKRRPPQRYQPC